MRKLTNARTFTQAMMISSYPGSEVRVHEGVDEIVHGHQPPMTWLLSFKNVPSIEHCSCMMIPVQQAFEQLVKLMKLFQQDLVRID